MPDRQADRDPAPEGGPVRAGGMASAGPAARGALPDQHDPQRHDPPLQAGPTRPIDWSQYAITTPARTLDEHGTAATVLPFKGKIS